MDNGRTFAVRMPSRLQGAALQRAMDAVAAQPGVASVEPDERLYPSLTPDDPGFIYQWSMKPYSTNSYGSNASGAWDYTTGSSSVVVAVVDSGYVDHPEYNDRILQGYDFVSNALSANDGGGRDNDAHDPGDWVTTSESVNIGGYFEDCTVGNSSWHGSHVAGIIGATGNNATGVAGVAWGIKILPVRVLGKCGGSRSDIVTGIRWAAGITIDGVPTNDHPAKVINLSLGGSSACSESMQAAITEVIGLGVTVVTAAGNEASPASSNEPGNCVGVINVAATGKYGELASYSNYGTGVDLAAPGGGIHDLGIRSTVDSGTEEPEGWAYGYERGTSMAAPHVTGAVAMILSVNPALSPASVKTVLTSTTRALPSSGTYATCVGRCGAGLLDVKAAVIFAAGLHAPGAPTGLVATSAPSSVSLSWVAPVDDGGAPITDYKVQRSSNGGLSWTTVADGISTATGFTVTGLTNGRTYTFRVAAINFVSLGATSDTATSVPATVPSKPQVLRSKRGPASVILTWKKPRSSGGAAVSDYVIEQSTDNLTWTNVTDSVTAVTGFTVTGLTNGTRYYFHIAATNSAGQSLWTSSTSMTPLAVPAAPTDLAGIPGNKLASLTWVAPTDIGGTAITSYVVQRSSNGGLSWTTVTGSSLLPSRTAKGLRNGTAYLFRVAAKNKVGRGPWSDTFGVTPRTKPTAPQTVVATAGDAQVTLTWLAPKSNGGNAITAYQVESSPDGINWTVVTSSIDPLTLAYTATSLANDVPVRFRIAAINEAGVGSYSSVRTATPTAPAP